MKIAVIDMGTNTFHLLIVDVKGTDFRIVYREKRAVKIGEKGIEKGMITPQAMERALDALIAYKEVIESYGVSQTFATATSAVRSASNGQELTDRIFRETNIQTRIISGVQEAQYIYYGVQRALDIGDQPSLIMDIGGGSIEFIICTGSETLWMQSFEIGGQRLVERFHRHDPIHPSDLSSLEEHLDTQLQELFEACKKYAPKVLIGSSGTFDTLSDIYCVSEGIERDIRDTEFPLTLESFADTFAYMLTRNREERLALPGMIPLRVDMIVVACVLIDFLISKLNLEGIRVSAYALKEGVLLSTIQDFKVESTVVD